MDWRCVSPLVHRCDVVGWVSRRRNPPFTIRGAEVVGYAALTHPTTATQRSLTRRCRIFGVVDLEQARIDLLGRIEIVDRDGGVVALRVGDGPLLELAVLGADHQHQPGGAD